ncbi:hypothetical protein M1545_02935 [Patescibacteria group bacterium]|nr:hypothetical protein [Patescibacteria group bacterium]
MNNIEYEKVLEAISDRPVQMSKLAEKFGISIGPSREYQALSYEVIRILEQKVLGVLSEGPLSTRQIGEKLGMRLDIGADAWILIGALSDLHERGIIATALNKNAEPENPSVIIGKDSFVHYLAENAKELERDGVLSPAQTVITGDIFIRIARAEGF